MIRLALILALLAAPAGAGWRRRSASTCGARSTRATMPSSATGFSQACQEVIVDWTLIGAPALALAGSADLWL